MNPSVKKFSTLFLIGAVLTSSLALGASAFLNGKDQASDKWSGLPDRLASEGYKISGAGPNGENLTDQVTDMFARQLVAANPEGPLQNEDGSVQLLSPSSTELFSYLAANVPPVGVLIPPLDESRIQVIHDFDAADVSGYISEITDIQNNVSLNPVWQNGLSAEADDVSSMPGQALEIAKTSEEARDRLYDTKTPAPFVPLQRSLIGLFSIMASFSNVTMQDPVAAVALSNELDMIITRQNASVDEAVKYLQENLPDDLSYSSGKDQSTIAALLGARVALAQFVPVTDPKHTTVTLAQWAKEFANQAWEIAKATALGALKNALVQRIGQKVLEWAEGHGVPGYVTNWAMYELNAGLSAQLGLVSRETAKVCGNAATAGLYGDILSSALVAGGVPGRLPPIGEPPGCPPVDSGFYNAGRGGYSPENFLNLLQNNVYNDLIRIKDRSIYAAAVASQAAVNEALSGRGLLDVKKCDDGTPVDNEGTCGDGSPARTVTPGSSKQDLVSRALASAQETITSANNQNMYLAIVAALTQAIVNYALQEGEGIFSRGSGGPPPFPGSGGGGSTGGPFVSLVADPANIPVGFTSTLTWSSSGMTSCSLGQAGGDTLPLWDVNGSLTTPPLETTTSWTITCIGSDGTNLTDTATVIVGSGGGSISPENLFVLTAAERQAFTPPEGYEPGWGGLIREPLESVWDAFNTDSLPATLSDYDDPDWYNPSGNGSQNHGFLWNGIGALGWALQGNAEQFDSRASKALQLLSLDDQQGHQRHESLGYGPYWTGPVAAMALAGLYAPEGSTLGPQLLAAARAWWEDHVAILRSLRMPDGQVAIIGARQNAPYEAGEEDAWYALYSAIILQLADPISYSQLHPEITERLTADGQPKRGNNDMQWYVPAEGVNMWLVLRAVQSGAFLPVSSSHQPPAVDMDAYKWTDGGRTYVASPSVCGYAPWRWKASWAPGEVLRVDVGYVSPQGPGDHIGKGPWRPQDYSLGPLNIPGTATHLFGPAGPATQCSY